MKSVIEQSWIDRTGQIHGILSASIGKGINGGFPAPYTTLWEEWGTMRSLADLLVLIVLALITGALLLR